ncbi:MULTISPECIES: hypothetical protein [Parachlamydia]|uniref:hypothetical protein n=1 Tax=Parachlamydia TaxID=83551 RepID=UPI0007508CC8|nr:hypothetical protein [Parachlamydia acanthamoebae]
MNEIIQNLAQFITALEEKKSVVCQNGYWYVESSIKSYFRRWFGFDVNRILTIGETWSRCLENLEHIPIQFFAPQKVDIELYLKGTESVLSLLLPYLNEKICHVRAHIKSQEIALRYRLEEKNGGWNRLPKSHAIPPFLFQKALEWKFYRSTVVDKELTHDEINRLDDACRYPAFIKHLQVDSDTCLFFLSWVLQDKNAPALFIEFPKIARNLQNCGLSRRIGRVNPKLLHMHKTPLGEKIIALRMEKQEVSLLDEHKIVCFRGNYRLSLQEIYKIFAQKDFEVGNLEVLADGVVNWNAHQLGWWDADSNEFRQIALSDPLWWQKMPIFEVISLKEAQRRYNLRLDPEAWNVAATSTREALNLDFENSHAFQEIAIPMPGKKFAIYPLGKFATRFPANSWERFTMLCPTVTATIAYPDENVFYNHRQHAYYSFAIKPEQGMKLMGFIKQDIEVSRAGNMVYQIESDNCALWSQGNLERLIGNAVPNLYRMPLLNTEPAGLVAYIFNGIKKLPKFLQVFVLTRAHLFMGAWRGKWIYEKGKKVWKSMRNHFFWETGEVYLPAFVHHQQEIGVLSSGVSLVQQSHRIIKKWFMFLLIKSSLSTLSLNPQMILLKTKRSTGFPRDSTC